MSPAERDEGNRLFRLAWDRTLVQSEWFDGEDAIAAAAKAHLRDLFRENGPTVVRVRTIEQARHREQGWERYFPTRIEAERYAATWDPYEVSVGRA